MCGARNLKFFLCVFLKLTPNMNLFSVKIPKKSMSGFFKFTLICLLTVYAPIELTRAIIINEIILNLHPSIPTWQFVAEIGVIWTLYMVAMVIIRRGKWLKWQWSKT